MKTKKKNTGPGEIIQHDTRIGSIAAESDDEFLFECFIDNVALSRALDLSTSGLVVSGRTGSGKTAVLKYVEKHKRNARIVPSEMALQYISNSEIIRFLNDIGADLDIFFQSIWKHVLCIEYIRLRYNISDAQESLSWFDRLTRRLTGDIRQARALEYLKNWEGRFWITIDENVREITRKYEDALNAELAIDLSKMKSKAGYGRNLSVDQKTEISNRARSIINSDQLSDLSKVLDLLKQEESSQPNAEPCFILIDDLDDRWVDESIKYRMIRALIESLRAFGKIQKLKILIALRNDVLERVMIESKDAGFQREKFKDFITEINWSEVQLREMVNRRVNYLYKRKYTRQNVHFQDVFADLIKGEDPFKFMIDRTLLRPRDAISFVNHCLKEAENSAKITSGHILAAERSYSDDRFQALLDEWRTTYPSLEQLFKPIRNGPQTFEFDSIAEPSVIEEAALPICTTEKGMVTVDPMMSLANSVFDTDPVKASAAMQHFARQLLSVLYRVGAVGVKSDPSRPYLESKKDAPLFAPEKIAPGVRFRVSRMLHQALNINASSDNRSGKR